MQRSIRLRTIVVVLAVEFAGWLPGRGAPAREAKADDPTTKVEQQEAKARKARYSSWMREYSEETAIELVDADPESDRKVKLVPQPIFRYSSDVFADDATLWVWTHHDRPIAFQKVEVNNIGGKPKWTICFGSTYEGLFEVRWPGERRFKARAPGVAFRPIPDAAPPGGNAKTRTAQLKGLKDRFTGHVAGWGPKGRIEYDLDCLPKPLFEYADPVAKLPLGAVFSLVNHDGGNLTPIFLLLVEARPDRDGKLRWEYAFRRLTIWSARLRLDQTEVANLPLVEVDDQIHDDWTFYFLDRDFE
jgi:hypothetical protein